MTENQWEFYGLLTNQNNALHREILYAPLIFPETLSKLQTYSSYFHYSTTHNLSFSQLAVTPHTMLNHREISCHCKSQLKSTLQPLLNCDYLFTPLCASFHSSISLYLPSGVALAGTGSFWGGSWWLSSGPFPSCCSAVWERWSYPGQTPSCCHTQRNEKHTDT